MAKQLNVNLAFNADTTKAKAQLQELQNHLNNLTKTTATQLPITKEIQEAQQATIHLKTALSQAVNVNTGKFDLSKFNQSIKTSGTSLEQIRNRLVQIGPSGQQAFLSLAQSIASAEIPARRTNALLGELGTTLKNTVKWQFSSSMLHGFMSAVQSAYRYAQDLNSSLNDIRIVTGLSADEMDKFAIKANKAAKALSASTLEYTNAALIYYQQGLDEKAVEERTKVTIKMANVTGEVASDVSDYMTAVWNNFAKGGESLEYYADVMTALGAATASSTDEIAAGLEKFAAVADTVGLSYEYATAALATVTATTRQSADVVGTAFKTLFARIQDLELGETLDDGTTLGSYSQALQKVGINIKNTNGELKDMDTILQEMAAKWETLGQAEKTALAQSVAGVRQYTQLIALMDNWDFMESNLDVANSATGTLQEQSEIYAESWEGARDRVKAAAEAIYSDLLDDDFFIGLTNGIEKVLTLFDNFLDAIGGAKGLLFGLSSILLNTFSAQAAKGLENMVYNLKSFVGLTQKEAIVTQQKAVGLASTMGDVTPVAGASMLQNSSSDATTFAMQSQLQLTQEVALAKEKMTAAQQLEAQGILDQNKAYADQLVILGQKADALKSERESAKTNLLDDAAFELGTVRAQEALSQIDADIMNGESIIAEVEQIEKAFKEGAITLEDYKAKMGELGKTAKSQGLEETASVIAKVSGRTASGKPQDLDMAGMTRTAATKDTRKRARKALTDKGAKSPAVDDKTIDKYISKTKEASKADKKFADGKKELEKNTANSSKAIKNLTNTTQQVSQTIVKTAQATMSLAYGINALSQLGSIWSDDTLSGGQKLLQTLMSLGTAIPMLMNGLTGMNAVLGVTSVLEQKAAIASQLYLAAHSQKLAILTAEQQAELAANMSKATGLSLDQAQIQVSNAVAAAKLQEAMASGTLTAASTAEQIASVAGISTDQAEIISKKLATGATLAEAMAEAGLTATKTGGIAASVMQIYTKGLESGARWANVVAIISEQTAMSPLLVMTLLLVAAMVALAAIIWAVVSAVQAIVAAYNADSIAAEKAESAAKELANAYNEAKASYEEMIAAMEEYQTARDALDSLTKGTEEYILALKEANRQALDLINTYDEYLSSDDYKWENGQLIIDDEALKNAQYKKSLEVDTAYAASVMGAANAKELRAVSDQTNLKRSYYDGNIGTAALQSIGSSIAATLLPGLGTILAPVVATASYMTYAAKQGEEYAFGKTLDAAMELYRDGNKTIFDSQENLSTALAEVGITDEKLIQALWENRDAAIELGAKFDAAELAGRAAAQENARNFIENSSYGNSRYAEDMAHMVGNQYYERQQVLETEIAKSMKNKAGLKAAADAYFVNSGIASQAGFKVDKYDKKNGTVKYSYIGEDGKREEKEVSAEFIAQMQAATEIQGELAESCKIVNNAFLALDGQLGSTNKMLNEGMKHFLTTGDTTELTKEQYDEMAKMSESELLEYLSDIGINDETVTNFGYEDMAAFVEAMNLSNVGESWGQYSNLTSLTGGENLTLAGAENITNAITELTDFFGEEIGTEMLNLSDAMAQSLDEASQAAFWEQLGQIEDFSDAEAWEAFLENMKESGELTEEEAKALENYVDTATLAAKATKDLNFDALAESVKSLTDVMDTIKEGTRDISQEQYDALVAQGIDTSKFAKTIDGWRYLGDTGEFAEEISNSIRNQFTGARENFNHLAETARQASANLTAAKESMAQAKAAGDQMRALKQEEFLEENRSKIVLANIMSRIQEIVTNGIQAAWQKICDVCVGIYDFFAKIYNWVGENITRLWNDFMSWLENLMNDIADKLVDILEFLGVDTSDFEGFDFGRMEFEAMKTSDEIAAEEETKKRQEEYDAAVQDIIDATPELVKAIEASADYLSEQELMAGRSQIESERAQAQTDYENAVNTYGENSSEALLLKDLLDSYDQQLQAYDKALASKAYGEIVQEGFDMKEVEAYADMLRETHKELELTEEEALKMAVAQKKMDRGMKTLVDTYEDWNDALESGDLEAKSKALTKLREGMTDLTGVDMSSLPASFFESEKNAQLLKDAINGDVDALRTLMGEATKQIIIDLDLNDEETAHLQTLVDNTINAIDVKDLEVGATLNDAGMYEAFQALLDNGTVTVNEMNDILSGIGFSPVIEYKEMTLGEAKKLNQKSYIQTADGEYTEVTTEMNLKDDAKVWVPIINGDKTTLKAPPAPSSYSGNDSGGGGGGSKPKKTADARKRKSDIVDPYKEVNDKLERTNHLMEMNDTLAEGLWGAERSAKMRDNIALLNQEVSLLEEKLEISKEQMNLSRQDLNSAAAVLGVSLDFDSDGLVTNIVDVQEAIHQKREALLDSFGDEIDEDEQEQLDAFDKYMENFTNAYDEYEEHRQTQMDAEAERLAKQLEAQQVMFDDLNKTLEENVSLIEKDLELVEYYLSKVEDDFFGMAEAAALMVGSLSSTNPGEGGQLGGYLDILAEQKRHKEELDAAYAKGEINQAQYIQGLMDCQSAIIEQLQNINELDKTMKGYYGETLEAAQEELSKYTDMMEHHSEVLEHYASLLELIGASKDWERMKTVLEAQVSVAENAAAVSKANYEMLAQEAADKKAAWDALGKGLGDELTYEESVIKQQWLDAQAAADEAQNQMLEDAEAWAESLKSLLETELAELADILNESLSGEFGSLDNMMTAMERANSLQEEYLTTTNQVYETNKLMHTAQQEIDKTTNSVAKRRLKQYIDETEQLQNKNKLSQFELDIQKAKYDLLVAEIALEEAQQAKSTVRLQRDSEGNFGYVYTADQNAVAEAEQELADAQNALYNIGLEGANKYAESYAQTIQEMNDAVTELTEKWQNGEITSKEEYQRQMLELEEYYGEKLMQYSELHSIALQTDSRVAADAWTKDFAHMTTQTQRWMQNVDVYVQGVEASMDRYQQGIDRVEEYAGLDLDSLKTKTQNIKDENKALAKSITEKDGLLDALKDEITEVDNLTTSYANLRTEIQGTVDDYEALLRRMGVEIDTAAAGSPPLGGGTEDPGTTDPGTTDPGTTDPGTTDPGTGGGTIKVGGKINAGSAQIYDYAGDTSGERQYFRSDPVYKVLKDNGDWIQVRHHKLSSGITGWFKKSDVTAMNTGGYTGDWAGSYGKLAFLHQKELVLNAQDTENLLASMDILDKIISTIDLYSSSAQLGGMLSSPRYGGFDSEPLEQNVHIEASFPSVTDHNEIEDALNNLINRASQYAHRK